MRHHSWEIQDDSRLYNVTSLGVIRGNAWQELQFVGSCNDISGQTQLEMKAGGMLGSRAGCCSKTGCTKRMTRSVFTCTVVQNIPQSAWHFRDGVNADKGDVTLLGPPVRGRTRLAIYGWILWLCVTPLSILQLKEFVYWPLHTVLLEELLQLLQLLCFNRSF